MKRSLFLPLVVLTVLLAACGTAAPSPPMGLARHPANSPDTLASLARPPGDPGATTAVPSGPAPAEIPNRLPQAEPAIAPVVRLKVFVLSDASAPDGIASVTPAQRDALISEARSARTVRLLCRGDRLHPSRAGWLAAVERGLKIKRFLVASGVEAHRIRIFARSAGAFVGDNSTPSGRAQNRRVEIHFE